MATERERLLLATWRPLGGGDRLYVESVGALPRELVDRLEALADTSRELCRAHAVTRIVVLSGGAGLAGGSGRPRRRE